MKNHTNKQRWLMLASVIMTSMSAMAGINVNPDSVKAAEKWRWHSYLSYATPTEIASQSADSLWVLASGALYLYEPSTSNITLHSKLTGLSDTGINHIAWSEAAHQLVVTYDNSRIDLVSTQPGDTVLTVKQMNDLYTYSAPVDKTINRITTIDRYALLSTGFGVVRIDVADAMFVETYRLGQNVMDVQMTDATGQRLSDTGGTKWSQAVSIWAIYKNGTVVTAQMTDDVMNPNAWHTAEQPSGLLKQTTKAWQKYNAEVRQLSIDGPINNNFYRLRLRGDKLLTVGGGYTPAQELTLPGPPQVLNVKNSQWQIYQRDISSIVTDIPYMDLLTIDEDPLHEDHVYVGSRLGMWEYQDGQCIAHHDCSNSPLLTALPDTTKFNLLTRRRYTIIEGLIYDSDGTMWITNSITHSDKGLLSLSAQGEWKSHTGALKSHNNDDDGYCHPFIDSRGLLWVNNQHWNDPSTTVIDIHSADSAIQVKRIPNRMNNQFGIEQIDFQRYCLSEDSLHNVWIGTNGGPVFVDAERCGDGSTWVTQPVVGEGIVGQPTYLLQGQPVFAIETDADGNLWMGSEGLYVIDPNDYSQLNHFTTDNSPLPSNSILDLEYDARTGIIYIATEKGLCSYQTDAKNTADTGITQPHADSTMRSKDNAYYTLSGQRLPSKPAKAGIYLWGGKKMVVK